MHKAPQRKAAVRGGKGFRPGVHCIVCSVQYAVCSFLCEICSVQCEVSSRKCAVCSVPCSVQCVCNQCTGSGFCAGRGGCWCKGKLIDLAK